MDIKLPEYLRKKAEVELNENPSRVSEDIEHLKSWLAKQPHLRAKEGQLNELNYSSYMLPPYELNFKTKRGLVALNYNSKILYAYCFIQTTVEFVVINDRI